jgi:arylsulfatase A-like enzyme/tetratricopeptide (TPR) repeat protein
LPPGTPVVLISVDTLRADHLPAWGYRGVATPALDRLRADGILVRHAWSPVPLTLPAHVSMLTGLLPPEHGVRANAGFTFRSPDHPSLPTLLKAQGYATGAAVSSYVLRAEAGLAAAFDFYDDGIDPSAGGAFGEYQRRGDVTIALAQEWIDAHRGAPFFFFLHLYEPHVPYDPPEPFRSRYATSPYDGEIARADELVGGFLDHLRQLGLYDRALVVFTSDHGEGLGDHGEDQHSILVYGETLRVPLLVKLPRRQRAGDTIEEPAQLTDLVPTIAALLGLPIPSGAGGRSLFALRGGPDRALYAETLYPRLAFGWSELRSLETARWHYIEGARGELYDLARDPGERHDVAMTEAAEVATLKAELEREHPLQVPAPAEVPREVAERLAALGYLGGARGSAAAASARPDPRASLPLLAPFQAAVRLAASGQPAESEAALRALLARSPAFVEARARLGDVLMDLGRPGEAGDAFAAAAAQAPSGDLWVALGQARLRQGRLEEADQAAARGLDESPTRAHELRARIALRRGDLARAQSEVEAAQQRARPLPSTLVVAAEVRVAAGDVAGGLRVLDQAEARAAEMRIAGVPELDFARADALARLNRLAEAEASYRRSIAAFPRHLQAWANLAVLLRLQGRQADLDRLVEQMVAANPGPAALDVAAKTFEALGDRARAEAWRRRVPRVR